MKLTYFNMGFSLIEILISLVLVSLTAVNIAGLQKMLSDQSKNNFFHTAVLTVVSKQFKKVMQYDDIDEVIALQGTTSTYIENETTFDLSWDVTTVFGASNTSSMREVSLTVVWRDAMKSRQTFVYSRQISTLTLVAEKGADNDPFAYSIANLLNTNDINYFEAKSSYKNGAYVIYNSQLFQATDAHFMVDGEIGNSNSPIDETGKTSSGWQNLGRIDNVALASLFVD
ncbi:MAG: hypothetical protein V5786_08090 [Psychromonas sp.]